MTPAEYRDRFNPPSETPLAGVAYSQQCLREDIWRRQPLWPQNNQANNEGVRLENGNYPTLSLFFVHITIH